MKKSVISVITATFLFTGSVQAENVDIAKSLRNIGGIYANQTDPNSWKDPSTGINYYSGGSLEVRFKSNTQYAPFFDARGPSIKAGCSGFSFDAGFASIIDLNGITSQLSQAATSIVGGFMSAILYATPILGDIIQTVKKISDAIQSMLENACNVGKALGNASSDIISSHLMTKDQDKYVQDSKDIGVLAGAKKFIDDKASDIKNSLNCFSQINGSAQCFKSSSSTPNDKDTEYDTIIESIRKIIIEKTNTEDIKGGMFAKTKNNPIYEDKFWIDRISLKDFLINNSNNRSDKGKFTIANSQLSYRNNKFAQLNFLLESTTYSSPVICKEIHSFYGAMDSNANASEKTKALVKIKKAIENEPNTVQKTIDSNTIVGISAGSNRAFSVKNDFEKYVLNGKVNNSQLTGTNGYVYIANLPASEADRGSADTIKYTYLCQDAPSKKPTFNFTWNGLPNISSVQTEIEKIAGIQSGAANTNVLITEEAAKLAKALSEKVKIESFGDKVLAPTISSYKIAKLNNYFIINAIYEALKSAEDDYTSSNGVDTNAVSYNKYSKVYKTIRQIKEKTEKELKELFSSEDFLGATVRDYKNINNKYKELSRKRTFNK